MFLGVKTDVNDAQWIQQLHQFGLLRASFRPDKNIAVLRSYIRQRERLLKFKASHIHHMQKALMQMNLQLHHVVSDVTGVTGMKIIRAIINGERNPEILAQFRDVRCKESSETIAKSLIGNYSEEHLFALKQAVELFDYYACKVDECEQQIAITLNSLKLEKDIPNEPLPKAKHRIKQPNELNFNVRESLYQLLNIDLTQIHGIGAVISFKIDIRMWN